MPWLILPRYTLVQLVLMGIAVQYCQVIAQMNRRADGLLLGKLDELAQDYVLPVLIDLMSTRVIASSRAELRAMLDLQRQSMLDRGVVSLRPEVTAMDLPRSGRFRVWVDWHEVTHSLEGERRSSAVYYCVADGANLKIEMIHYLTLATPELRPQVEALSLTA